MCFTGPSFGMDCPEDTGLEGSPGAEGGLSHHQRTGRRSRSSLEVMLWNCYPSDICLWEEWRTQWRDSVFGIHAFLKLLLALSLLYQVSLYCHPPDWFRSASSPLSLAPTVDPAFFSNIMIHWLWLLWAVSLKSVCLLSATTEWYINSITCNFLGFIRCIYSPCNSEDCSFLLLSSECQARSWKPLSGVRICQDCATKFISGKQFKTQIDVKIEFLEALDS